MRPDVIIVLRGGAVVDVMVSRAAVGVRDARVVIWDWDSVEAGQVEEELVMPSYNADQMRGLLVGLQLKARR